MYPAFHNGFGQQKENAENRQIKRHVTYPENTFGKVQIIIVVQFTCLQGEYNVQQQAVYSNFGKQFYHKFPAGGKSYTK
jgi:hypothetical protein